MNLNEVYFGTAKIQKLRRIALDQNLLSNLNLKEGDCLEVVLHLDTGEIRLRKCVENKPREDSQRKGEKE